MSEDIEGLDHQLRGGRRSRRQRVGPGSPEQGSLGDCPFRYQEYDRQTGTYGPDKFTIRRYQKRNGQFLAKSKFNISSRAQAEKIVKTLEAWLAAA